jgi:RimJ/RimL family protein N-acetyltransferase
MDMAASQIAEHDLPHILATTLPENTASVKLLEKLGLTFERELEADTNRLYIYGASVGKLPA